MYSKFQFEGTWRIYEGSTSQLILKQTQEQDYPISIIP